MFEARRLAGTAPPPRRVEPREGQESVWDYPRPPRVEDCPRLLEVMFAGVSVARTRRGKRVLETSLPPSYYAPPADVRTELLRPGAARTRCEWKGEAAHWDLVVGERVARDAAWSYPRPNPGYEAIAGFLAFYPARVDACLVDGQRARPQEGGFYGGWVTSHVAGPFKGAPGSEGW